MDSSALTNSPDFAAIKARDDAFVAYGSYSVDGYGEPQDYSTLCDELIQAEKDRHALVGMVEKVMAHYGDYDFHPTDFDAVLAMMVKERQEKKDAELALERRTALLREVLPAVEADEHFAWTTLRERICAELGEEK